MKVLIKDRRVLENISPSQIMGFVRHKGAIKKFSYRNVGFIWEYKGKELLVPNSSGIADYAERILQIIKIFSDIESKSEIQILTDIRSIDFDIIRIRNNSDEVHQGNMNFLHCLEFINYSREMLLSAACSTATAKISYLGKKPVKAEDYIQTVRFGQTEEGSFIIQLLSPVMRTLNEQGVLLDMIDDQPYEMKVVPMLVSGLNALNIASLETSQDDDIDHFINKASKGLTTNLCDAITGIYSSIKPRSLDINVIYSCNRRNNMPSSSITIYKDNISLIAQVSSTLKNINEITDSEQLIRGPIIKLISEDPSQGGEIIIRDLMNPKPRNIKTHLNKIEYHNALNAHDKGLFIEINGILERSGNIFKIEPSSEIRFFNPIEE